MVIIASQHKVFEATTSVLVLGVAGSCTAVIFQATEPGFAPLVLGFMEQCSTAIRAEFALEWGLEAVLGVSRSLSSFLQSSTSFKNLPFYFP